MRICFPGGASGKESTCQCRRHKRCRFNPWVGKMPWRRAWQLTSVFLPEESLGQTVALWATVHRVTKSQTQLKWLSTHACALVGLPCGKESAYQCRRHRRHGFHPWIEKIPWRRKATHSSILAWEIPWTEEPGRLQSMWSPRVSQDWATGHTLMHVH